MKTNVMAFLFMCLAISDIVYCVLSFTYNLIMFNEWLGDDFESHVVNCCRILVNCIDAVTIASIYITTTIVFSRWIVVFVDSRYDH